MIRPLAAKNRECRELMSNEFHIKKTTTPISFNCVHIPIYLVVYATVKCITYMIPLAQEHVRTAIASTM